jgi:hypothetical protein
VTIVPMPALVKISSNSACGTRPSVTVARVRPPSTARSRPPSWAPCRTRVGHQLAELRGGELGDDRGTVRPVPIEPRRRSAPPGARPAGRRPEPRLRCRRWTLCTTPLRSGAMLATTGNTAGVDQPSIASVRTSTTSPTRPDRLSPVDHRAPPLGGEHPPSSPESRRPACCGC